MINSLFNKLKYVRKKRLWRHISKHNETYMGSNFDIDAVKVGKASYGLINVISYSDLNRLFIGNYCSIAPEVVFILNGEHPTNMISTFPFKNHIIDSSLSEALSYGNIVVEDDVWIGYRSTIMSGVHIGQGAVVAAGAVVTKDVPPYAIVGGVPAKVIKYRFEPDIIDELLKVDYSKLTKEMIEEHIDDLYVELRNKEQLKWMPKKETK